jgi:hypothetical protein
MATRAAPQTLAAEARRQYAEQLTRGLPALAQATVIASQLLLDKPAEYSLKQRRRDLVQALMRGADAWQRTVAGGLRHALLHGVSASRVGELIKPPAGAGMAPLTLVDDDTIEREILTSRLALAIMDRASWEFTDLRSRVASLERRAELEPHDMLRAHVLARVAVDAWRASGFALEGWRDLQQALHDEFAALVEEAYHEVNRSLMAHGVLPDVDLRPFIKRTRPVNPQSALGSFASDSGVMRTDASGHAHGHGGVGAGHSSGGLSAGRGPGIGVGGRSGGVHTVSAGGGTGHGGGGGVRHGGGYRNDYVGEAGDQIAHRRGGNAHDDDVGEETRMLTRATPLPRSGEHAEAVLGRLNRLVARHLPGFAGSTEPQPLSPKLRHAISDAQDGIRRRVAAPAGAAEVIVTTPALLDDLHQRKQMLKQAAATPQERATIEIVALLFQSLLTEERIPPAVRVWFARLQMPVLRVAVTEPDFFATTDHPARRLIDRMGACVMGFDSSTLAVGDALEKEIKRIVQVVEAYPDTGRRVFQTVLTEFEKFLDHYMRNRSEATRKAVSLAQQVEQRETLAVQYTIELRKMLNEVPVQEGVRQFLFQVWADVLATTAVRYGGQGEQTKGMKRAAADLIWSASAKVTREERGEVIRRLPPLLKSLREGMAAAGMDAAKQDEQIKQLNNSLAAAFTAKAAVIPHERLAELMEQLETLEELMPETEDVQIDESIVREIAGESGGELEVITDGGSMPTPAMLAWARELQVGTWYMLERGGANQGKTEAVQLAWHGLRKQLSLFVNTHGKTVLFQQQRLASYLQAGLLLPAQDEALTVRATRSALAKLDVEPSRLLE